ncbi:hypothetical protein F2Q69_00003645 [Brassica cretica]|uniref:Uncharacterized protein n=1 Tax=Brassica cretica TaxID=69181 RepID=A0A8S9PLG8_BRACR|nr:hypothetical protein F2Q69_00003645 [Brassica cretica]
MSSSSSDENDEIEEILDDIIEDFIDEIYDDIVEAEPIPQRTRSYTERHCEGGQHQLSNDYFNDDHSIYSIQTFRRRFRMNKRLFIPHGNTIQTLLFPDPSVQTSPQGGEAVEEDTELEPHYRGETPNRATLTLTMRHEKTMKMKSIIISPKVEKEREQEVELVPFQREQEIDNSRARRGTSPQGGEAVEEDTELEPHYRGETPNRATLTLTMRHEKTMKMKSIIISPKVEKEREQEVELVPFQREQEIDNSREDTETLLEFQNKVRCLGSRSGRTRLPRNSPKILKGASSKKRRISQL